jgi:hypothetical protein
MIIPSDRRTNWVVGTTVGVEGTIAGVNATRTVQTTADVAYGNGTTPASDYLWSLWVNAPDDSIIDIPAGTYLLDSPMVFPSSGWLKNKTIRGAGRGLTILKVGYGTENPMIKFGNNAEWPVPTLTPGASITCVAGNSYVTCLDTSALSEGGYVSITYTNLGYNAIFNGGNAVDNSSDNREFSTHHYVTSISGTQVNITPPV